MLCPVCKSTELKMADRQGVEIDYCPTCRGVWLDRGELDKIIERSAAIPVGSSSRHDDEAREKREYRSESERPASRRDYDEDRRYDSDYDKKKKKRGFLVELFDF